MADFGKKLVKGLPNHSQVWMDGKKMQAKPVGAIRIGYKLIGSLEMSTHKGYIWNPIFPSRAGLWIEFGLGRP